MAKLLALGQRNSNHSLSIERYEAGIYKYLKNARDFKDFKTRIEEQLCKLGFSHWGFAQLDLPSHLTISELVGNTHESLLVTYLSDSLHEYDFLLKHTKASDLPAFQSDIASWIKKYPLKCTEFDGFKELLALCRSFEYKDSYCIPLKSIGGHDNRVLFSVNAQKINQEDFRKRVNVSANKLHVLGQVINDISRIKFQDDLRWSNRSVQPS